MRWLRERDAHPHARVRCRRVHLGSLEWMERLHGNREHLPAGGDGDSVRELRLLQQRNPESHPDVQLQLCLGHLERLEQLRRRRWVLRRRDLWHLGELLELLRLPRRSRGLRERRRLVRGDSGRPMAMRVLTEPRGGGLSDLLERHVGQFPHEPEELRCLRLHLFQCLFAVGACYRNVVTFDGTETWELEVEATEDVGVVTVVEGPDHGLEAELGDEVTVGTSEAATVRLSDPTVSRLHLSLRREGEGLRVRDLGSKNGTFVGALRLHDGAVAAGTHLRLGSTEIKLGIRPGLVRRAVWDGGNHLGELVGGSSAMHQLFAAMMKVAGTESRVLLLGESGTGKELVARTLHSLGRRREGPFVVVDAAAMAGTLIEDELFGHVRGAFTGAVEDHPGAFERAHKGTLFLDEIGDLPLALQAKLLRVLEEGSVQRLGDTRRVDVDVRVVAATHKPLARMVNERTFREDLYYRLAVIELRLPPLRQRALDVPLLARHILHQDGRLSEETLAAVEQALDEHRGYTWPGNVRELRNFVRRVAVLGVAHAQLMPADREPRVRVDLNYHHAKDIWVEHFERDYVSRILEEVGGNVSQAARRAGLSRVHLANLMARHGLRE